MNKTERRSSLNSLYSFKFFFLSVFLTVAYLSTGALEVVEANTCKSRFSQATLAVRTEAQIPELKILSYNVENLFYSTGKGVWEAPGKMVRLKEKGPEPKSPEELSTIRKIILENEADIVILTEVESLNALKLLTMNEIDAGAYRPLLVEGNDPRGIDIGFLVKSDLPWHIKFVSHKNTRWKDPQSGYEAPLFSRDLPVLEMRRNESDPEPLFVVIGNHAKSKRDMKGDRESRRWRTAQYEEAARIVEAYDERGVPVVFAGDFNADIRHDPEVLPIKRILKSSLDIAPDALPEDQRVTHTFHPRGASTHFSQMDDILVSSSLTGSILSSRILRYKGPDGQTLPIPQTYEARSRQPSDHFPVLTRISTRRLFDRR